MVAFAFMAPVYCAVALKMIGFVSNNFYARGLEIYKTKCL